VQLLSGYVGIYVGTWWLFGRRVIAGPTFDRLNATVYAPVAWCLDGYPGSSDCQTE